MPRTFAYCRVSTAEQTTQNQLQEIEGAGFAVQPKRMVAEQVSGSVPAMSRKGFSTLVDKMEEGDVLVVTKMDRLGRDTIDVLATLACLKDAGIRVHCLALGGTDLTSATGKMIMTVLAAVAEFERDLLIERTQAGLQRAKREGKTLGRPSALTQEQQDEVLAKRAQGESLGALASHYGVSRSAIQRIERKAA